MDMLQSAFRGSRPCPDRGRAAFSLPSVGHGIVVLLASWVLSTGAWPRDAAGSVAATPLPESAAPEAAALQAVAHPVSLIVRPSTGGAGDGGRSRVASSPRSVLLAFPVDSTAVRRFRIPASPPRRRRRVASQPHRATAPPSTS